MNETIINEIEPDVRPMLEREPPHGSGLWKLTDSEMGALATYLADLIYRAHSDGWDQGYDACVDHLKEGIATMENGEKL